MTADVAQQMGSDPVAEVRSQADQRMRRQRQLLRPLGLAMIVFVGISAASAHPSPAVHDRGLGVTLALCAFIAATLAVMGDRFPDRSQTVQLLTIAGLGAAGVALAALQPQGASEVAAAMAVFFAVARLPGAAGITLGLAITACLDVGTGLVGSSSPALLARTLLCLLLGLTAYLVRQSRESQDRTELLLAQLQEAQEQRAQAAAVAERARIAGELHDVLAHALSGAAIQLQGARMLAERQTSSQEIRSAIDRASALVKDGLANARQAVGALRGEKLPGVAELGSLIDGFATDLELDVALVIEGAARTLPADASLAVYRAAQEALTNVARYAPGAHTSVVLRYEPGRTRLRIENQSPDQQAAGDGLPDVGGGHGLSNMRERLERCGGTLAAGPTGQGWRVELEVPA